MLSLDQQKQYRDEGYTIVRGFVDPAAIADLAAIADALHAEGLAHGRPFRHGNLFFHVSPGDPPAVRMVQWPVWRMPRLDVLRTDPRYLALLEPLLGPDIKQIIHQFHWKAAGRGGDFAWHQDSRSRRPASAYRNLSKSYVQTGLAIDPHTADSGCLKVIPGSHLRGDLKLREDETVLGRPIADSDLLELGIDPAGAVDLVMAPGDLALWSPYTLHASGTNRAAHQRRLLINGYVKAADCDRGEWAFRGGMPVPLPPAPSLVHFDGLAQHPDPHYPAT